MPTKSKPGPESGPIHVEWRLIETIRPYPGNPRTITEAAVEKVAESIRAFGWRQPIVVDRDGTIIVGHTRRQAAIRLGLDKVPVHVAADMTEAEARAYRLADNRVADETRWNLDALAVELTALSDLQIDVRSLGFEAIEIPGLEPAVAEIEAEAVTRLDEVTARTCPHCGGRLP